MTLNRQLCLFVVMIFIAMFIGTFSITVKNSRDYLINQLQTHAEDSATMLGLSASYSMQDRAALETLINAAFDSGDYRMIQIMDKQQNIIVERSVSVIIESVPEWFIALLPLPTPQGRSFIMQGWKEFGSITVESHPGYAYLEAWRNMTQTLAWFLVSSVVILLLGMAYLGNILRPLKAVEKQAESIARKDFIVLKELPKTRELRQIVSVMNQLSERVSKMFNEQSELAESYRKQAFSNLLTGLPNRRYFDARLTHLLRSDEEFEHGALILVGLDNLGRVNREVGFQNGDELIKKAANILSNRHQLLHGALLAHISGSEFALLLLGSEIEDIEQIADDLSKSLLELKALGLRDNLTSVSIGLALIERGSESSEILSQADHALRHAQMNGGNRWYRNPEHLTSSPALKSGAGYWQKKLHEILRTGQSELHFQPVIDRNNRILHFEVLSRIRTEDNRVTPAGVFVPMAERAGLATDLDKLTIMNWLSGGSEATEVKRFAINLSPGSVGNPDFVNWLEELFETNPMIHSNLVFELPEYAMASHQESLEKFQALLDRFDCGLAIDHFGSGFHTFKYLSRRKIEYLKIDGSFIRGVAENREDRFFVRTLTKTAHELEIPVIAECVETIEQKLALSELHVDGFQGFLIAEPRSQI